MKTAGCSSTALKHRDTARGAGRDQLAVHRTTRPLTAGGGQAESGVTWPPGTVKSTTPRKSDGSRCR